MRTCAHCGRDDVGAGRPGGWGRVGWRDLCHPNPSGMARPDCYRLVTVYGHTIPCGPCTRFGFAVDRARDRARTARVHRGGASLAGMHAAYRRRRR